MPNYLSETITVDPGWNTGYAIWNGEVIPETDMFKVSKKKVIASTEARLENLWEQFDLLLAKHFNLMHLIIESVMLFEGSLIGMTSARRGDVFKLAMLVGGYCAIALDHGLSFKLVSAREWKGQLNKKAVMKRIERRIGVTYTIDHIADAVGIGLSEMEML